MKLSTTVGWALVVILTVLLASCEGGEQHQLGTSPTPSAVAETSGTPVTPTERNNPSTQAPTIVSTPTKLVVPHPLSTRTGLSSVDRVLAALQSHDASQLRQVVRLAPVPCVAPADIPGAIGPPCMDGQAVGSLVLVLVSAVCQPDLVVQSRIADTLALLAQTRGVFAIFEVPHSNFGVLDSTQANAVFVLDMGLESPALLLVADGSILEYWRGCGTVAEALDAAKVFILPLQEE